MYEQHEEFTLRMQKKQLTFFLVRQVTPVHWNKHVYFALRHLYVWSAWGTYSLVTQNNNRNDTMAYGRRILLVLLLYNSVVDLAVGQDPTIRGVQYSLELLGDDLRSVGSSAKGLFTSSESDVVVT